MPFRQISVGQYQFLGKPTDNLQRRLQSLSQHPHQTDQKLIVQQYHCIYRIFINLLACITLSRPKIFSLYLRSHLLLLRPIFPF